jgi:hypothetical protein
MHLRQVIVALLLTLAGCTSTNGQNGQTGHNGQAGPPGPTGPTGPTGAQGPPGLGATNDGGSPFTCKPLSSWCEGTINYACTRSGYDATGYDCARASTPSFTYKCYDSCPGQPAGFGACCALDSSVAPAPSCAFAVTSPETFSGDNNTLFAGYCDSPDPCTKNDLFYISFSHNYKTCPSSGYYFNLRFSRAKVAVGSTVTLPSADINLGYEDQGTSTSCDAWSGSVTFTSDAPTWQIVIDATCTQGLAVHLAGTFHGTVH